MDFGITVTRRWINSIDVNTAHTKNCDVTTLSHWTFRQWTVCILTAERHSEVTSTHERVIYDDRLCKPERVPQSANFVRAGLTQLSVLSLTSCHVSALNQGSNSCVLSLHRQLCRTAAVQFVLSARKVNMTVQPNTQETHERMHCPTRYTRHWNNWTCLIRGTRHIWSRVVTVQTSTDQTTTPHIPHSVFKCTAQL
jgi:hypothetical protein